MLQKNLYKCGMPVVLFDDQKKDIDSLVNRRNSIAHGNNRSRINEVEYDRWENQTYMVMGQMIRVLFDYVYNRKYLVRE